RCPGGGDTPCGPPPARPRAAPRARPPPPEPPARGGCRRHRRPLPVAREVRPQAGPQVARTADVEDLVVAAEEEVDAWTSRRAVREVPLVEQTPRTRCGQRGQVGDGVRTAFLRQPDQREQQLAGRAG